MLSKARCTIENIIILKNVIISLSIIHIHLIFLYFSLSEHEANTTELHPKVGPNLFTFVISCIKFHFNIKQSPQVQNQNHYFQSHSRWTEIFSPFSSLFLSCWHFMALKHNAGQHAETSVGTRETKGKIVAREQTRAMGEMVNMTPTAGREPVTWWGQSSMCHHWKFLISPFYIFIMIDSQMNDILYFLRICRRKYVCRDLDLDCDDGSSEEHASGKL